MTRRGLFASITAAIVASSIEVLGWGAGECEAGLNDEELYRDMAITESYPNQELVESLYKKLLKDGGGSGMPTWDWNGSEWVKNNPPSVD